MNTVAVEIEGLHHDYGDQRGLDDFQLSVQKGEIMGILGPNGAGKTTLFRVLSTLLPVQKGSVQVMGKTLQDHQEEIRSDLAVVFQTAHVDPVLTARENMAFHAAMYGFSGREISERRSYLLDRFQLTDRVDDPVKTFSGGMRRRLEVVMSLLHQPSFMLLDEPTSGLDLSGKNAFWKDLNAVNEEEELTVLLATHDMEEAEICHNVAFINEGTCIRCDQPEKLKQELGTDVVFLDVTEPEAFSVSFSEQFDYPINLLDGRILVEPEDASNFIPEVVERYPGQIESVTMRKPTLGDVFLKLTGTELT